MNNAMSTTDVRVGANNVSPLHSPQPDLTRTCNKCGETKPLNEFRKNHTCLHGREPVCRECRNEASRQKTAAARAKRLAAKPPKPENPEDYIKTKVCRMCKQIKPLALFVSNKSCKDGRESICKACRKIRNAEIALDKCDATPAPAAVKPAPDPYPGNDLEDYIQTKLCRSCGKTKPLALFPNDNASKDGREDACKACRTEDLAGAVVIADMQPAPELPKYAPSEPDPSLRSQVSSLSPVINPQVSGSSPQPSLPTPICVPISQNKWLERRCMDLVVAIYSHIDNGETHSPALEGWAAELGRTLRARRLMEKEEACGGRST